MNELLPLLRLYYQEYVFTKKSIKKKLIYCFNKVVNEFCIHTMDSFVINSNVKLYQITCLCGVRGPAFNGSHLSSSRYAQMHLNCPKSPKRGTGAPFYGYSKSASFWKKDAETVSPVRCEESLHYQLS